MTQFKEINGQLCLMLEKPIPLTENAKFPCVVRLIQDSSPMGRYNNRLSDQCLLPFICVGIDNKGDMERMENAPRFGHECYELLGYPVADNSAEWALYRMMQLGKKVTKRHLKHTYWHYDARPHLKCISEYNCGKLQIMVSPDIWIKTADREGWQLYAEPKPLAVQVGDYVRTANGDGKVIEVPLTSPEVMLSNGQRGSFHADEISVISPAEVVVTIGCLTGTVAGGWSIDGIPVWFHLIDADGKVIATIRIKSLNTTTRELVEKLLDAQKKGDIK